MRANEQIRSPQVQVIDENGKNLGILDTSKAIEIAKERELDLVEISSKTQPPICKIINYGKYQYLQEKKERKQKAKQRRAELKEIRIGFTTSVHDLEIKAKQIEKFLKEGHKVKIDLRLRGREKAHGDLAKEKLEKFLGMFSFEFKKEEEIKKTPFGITTTICPGKPKNQ
ncbi:MAG: translation initiation factor IF-3 [Patescibacteria group bacterium]